MFVPRFDPAALVSRVRLSPTARRRAGAVLILTIAAAAPSGFGLGCASFASDASTGSGPVSNDAGNPSPSSDAGGGPSSDAGGVQPGPARMVALHASPDLFDYRLCFAVARGGEDASTAAFQPALPSPSDPAHPMPRTNYPGVASANGADIDGVDALVGAARVTPYLLNARQLSLRADWRNLTCEALFDQKPSDFVENVDYIRLAPLDANALRPGKTTVLVVSGCRALILSGAASAARCGDDYDKTLGNLRGSALVLRDDGVYTPSSFGMNAQFVQLAPALGADTKVRAVVGRVGRDGRDPLDASADADGGFPSLPLGVAQKYLEAPSAVTPIPLLAAADAGDLTPFYTTGVAISRELSGGGDAGAPLRLAVDFEAIARISAPTSLPSTYFANGNYLFALVGDPTDPAKQLELPDGAANPAFDGTGLHVVAIPLTRSADAGRSAFP